jgi:hypothetical protein
MNFKSSWDRLMGGFESMVIDDMIKIGLDPLNKDDIKYFWSLKLPKDEDQLNAS